MALFASLATLLSAGSLMTVRLLGTGTSAAAGTSAILAALLVSTWVMTRWVNRKPFGAAGLTLHSRTLRDTGVGILVGFVMMSGIFLVEYGAGFVTVETRGVTGGEVAGLMLSSALLFALAAMVEEVLFRGYLFQTLMQAWTFVPAAAVFSLLFALAHFGNPSGGGLLPSANIAIAGLWLSFAYLKTRSLWLPFGLHFGWNFAQSTVYSFPTSGYAMTDRHLLVIAQSGPEWITGGAFGPEGGVLATVALVLGTVAVLKSRVLAAPEGIITLDSLEDLVPETPSRPPTP